MLSKRLRFGAGIALTAVAGFVDAVAYIELGGFFASFMSGASISLGVGVTEGQWAVVSQAAFLVAAFVIAATTSSMLSGIARPWSIPAVLFLEATFLSIGILMIESGWSSAAAVIPVVAAMGVQNTALHPINGVRLGVTFMTGTMVSLSHALGGSLIGREPRWSWTPHATVWTAFIVGAAAGAKLYLVYGFVAIAAPTLVVWALVALTTIVLFLIRKQRQAAAS